MSGLAVACGISSREQVEAIMQIFGSQLQHAQQTFQGGALTAYPLPEIGQGNAQILDRCRVRTGLKLISQVTMNAAEQIG